MGFLRLIRYMGRHFGKVEIVMNGPDMLCKLESLLVMVEI